MAWTAEHTTDFSQAGALAAVAAGVALYDGWTDDVGNLFSTATAAPNSKLVASGSASGSSSILARPSAENKLNQRIVLTITGWSAAGLGTLSARLRWVDASNWYTFEITATTLKLFGNKASQITQIGATQTFTAITAGHNLTLDCQCVGKSPTTVKCTLTDTTSSTVLATLTVIDSVMGPTAPGKYGIGSNGGFTEQLAATCYNLASNAISLNDSHLYFSPWNWEYDGGGAPVSTTNVGSAATKARTNNAGAYLKIAWTGGSLYLTYAQTPYVASPQDYPRLGLSTDNGPWQEYQLSSADTSGEILAGNGGDDVAHTTEIVILGWGNTSNERWTYPALGSGYAGAPFTLFEIDSLRIEGTGTLQSPTLRPNLLLAVGDSITEGLHSSANNFANQDARTTYVLGLSALLNAEYGMIGWSGAGIGVTGGGNAPTAITSYANYRAGASRLQAGLLAPAPTYITVCDGANDAFQSRTNLQISTDLTTLTTDLTAAAPNSTCFALVEPGRFAKTAILAATLPANWFAVDPGADEAAGLTNNVAGDGTGFSASTPAVTFIDSSLNEVTSTPFTGLPSSKSYDTSGHGDGGHLSVAAQMEFCMWVATGILKRTLGQAEPRIATFTGGFNS